MIHGPLGVWTLTRSLEIYVMFLSCAGILAVRPVNTQETSWQWWGKCPTVTTTMLRRWTVSRPLAVLLATLSRSAEYEPYRISFLFRTVAKWSRWSDETVNASVGSAFTPVLVGVSRGIDRHNYVSKPGPCFDPCCNDSPIDTTTTRGGPLYRKFHFTRSTAALAQIRHDNSHL